LNALQKFLVRHVVQEIIIIQIIQRLLICYAKKMNLFLKMIINTISIMVVSYVLPGVSVANFLTGLVVAVFLSLLNMLVKPVLIILTLPVTIVTLGLFLLIINGLMVLLVSHFIEGFSVAGIWSAVFFSLLVSLVNSVLGADRLKQRD
jgi:putative membrane protein